METVSKPKSNTLNQGKIISVRGSVVDVFFENSLPPIYTLLHTGKNKEISIEVLTQLDIHRVRGIALTSGLFDTIPINKMHEAEVALQKINTELPADIVERLFSDKELNDSDREAIIKLAENTLLPFQSTPETDQNDT